MAKFCGNCGARLEDDARVCGQCGMSQKSMGSIPGVTASPEKAGKTGKIIVVLIAVITVVAIGITLLINFTGTKGLLRNVMSAYERYDIDALISMSSDMYYYGLEDFVEYYFEDSVGGDLDYFEEAVGPNYKLSYKVDEMYTLSGRKLDEMLEDIEESSLSLFDVSIIDKIVAADVTVTAKKGSKSVDTDLQVIISKENGKWKLLYIE